MANRKRAIAELTADDRGLQRGLARAEKRLGSFRKMTVRGFKGLMSAGGKVAGGLLGGGALAGGALVASEAAKTMQFEENLTRLGINAGGAVGNLDDLRRRIFEISTETGVAREDVLAAAASFVALTGDGKAAANSMDLFARISKGTGSSMADIASSAAAMQQNLQIDPKQFEKAFSILIRGGKAGSVELKDMASLLAGLAPQAARFKGGLGTEGLADLSSALQLTRQGFGSASEAATGLEALMSAITAKAGKLRKAGVKVFDVGPDGTKTLKSLPEIVEAIANSKLMKDPTALKDAFGRTEALRAFEQLVKVKGAWSDLASETMTARDVAEDYATFQDSAAGRMQTAWNGAKNRIAEALTPDTIETFTTALIAAIGAAEKLFGTLSMVPSVLDDAAGWIYNLFSDQEKENARVKKEADAMADAAIAKAKDAVARADAALLASELRWSSGLPAGEAPTMLEADAAAQKLNNERAPLANEFVVSVKPSREFDAIVAERQANSPRQRR